MKHFDAISSATTTIKTINQTDLLFKNDWALVIPSVVIDCLCFTQFN